MPDRPHIMRPEEIAAMQSMQNPSADAQAIIATLQPILQAISNQMDLLIRIECGQVSRASMKKKLNDFDARLLAQQNGHVSAEQAVELHLEQEGKPDAG